MSELHGPYHRQGEPGGPGCEVGTLPILMRLPEGGEAPGQLLDAGKDATEIELLRTVASEQGAGWGRDELGWWAAVPSRTAVVLPRSVSGAVRQFSFWMANRTVGYPLLEGVDYSCIFEEPSALEQAYAIFMNVLALDDNGNVTNEKHAERRAAQYIMAYVTEGYEVDPPLEDWEVALH